jgi:hypothetical protein
MVMAGMPVSFSPPLLVSLPEPMASGALAVRRYEAGRPP